MLDDLRQTEDDFNEFDDEASDEAEVRQTVTKRGFFGHDRCRTHGAFHHGVFVGDRVRGVGAAGNRTHRAIASNPPLLCARGGLDV